MNKLLNKMDKRIESIKKSLISHSLSVLNIEATSKCNLNCVFCGMHSNKLFQDRKEKKHMSLGLFKEVIKKSKMKNKFKVLYLHGHGEPLLNPNIVEMITIAKRANIAEQIILVTNGILLKPDKFQKIVKAGVGTIRISLDAITPTKFRYIKGMDLGLKVIENIENCIELIKAKNLNIELIILCAALDDKLLGKETRKIIHHFKPLIKDSPNIIIQPRRIFNWVDSINKISDKTHNQFRPFPCEHPFYLLMVHFDGDISTCCADTKKKLVIKNISEINNLKEIIVSDQLKIFRENLLLLNFDQLPVCKQCEVFSLADNMLLKRKNELLKILD